MAFQRNVFQNNAFQMFTIIVTIPEGYDYLLEWTSEILEMTMLQETNITTMQMMSYDIRSSA